MPEEEAAATSLPIPKDPWNNAQMTMWKLKWASQSMVSTRNSLLIEKKLLKSFAESVHDDKAKAFATQAMLDVEQSISSVSELIEYATQQVKDAQSKQNRENTRRNPG